MENRQEVTAYQTYEVQSSQRSTKDENKLQIVEKGIKFAHFIASSDAKTFPHALKDLKMRLNLQTKDSFTFADHDFIRICRKLWYCMWISVQESQAEELANLVNCFKPRAAATETAAQFHNIFSWRLWVASDSESIRNGWISSWCSCDTATVRVPNGAVDSGPDAWWRLIPPVTRR